MDDISRLNKRCRVCGELLTNDNCKIYRIKRYVYLCNKCMNEQKKKEAKIYREKNKSKVDNRSKKCKEKLLKENPKLYKCREMYSSARKRALKKGFAFDITPDFLYEIAPDFCPYLKRPLNYRSKNRDKYASSLDRIDSSKGYTKDNVQIISYLANLMKNNATDEELVIFAKSVLERYNLKN